VNLADPDNNANTHNPADGDPFNVIMGPEGHTLQFTINVEENGEQIGTESYSTRIGGVVRYLPPSGYNALLATINDSTSLSSNNNGNGIPEPGEKIEITVTLINLSSTSIGNTVIRNITATLDTSEYDVRTDSSYYQCNFGSTSGWSGGKRQGFFRFTIDPEISVDKIPFTLTIEGDINGITTDLGADTFVIPVKRQ